MKASEEGVIFVEILNISKPSAHIKIQTRKRTIITNTESKIIRKKQHQILHITTQMTMYQKEDIDLMESGTTAASGAIGMKIAGF